MNNTLFAFLIVIFFSSCGTGHDQEIIDERSNGVHVEVLGVAQDAGYPQASCAKECCQRHYSGEVSAKLTSCIGVIDRASKTYWMVDATPDFKEQIHILQTTYPDFQFGGIFLTHAHVGHYTGLIHLGREIMGADQIPVYAMPKMAGFIENNGPWSQLVSLKNINLIPIKADSTIHLNSQLSIIPFLVPHRDEYSETVGYKIIGKESTLLFIPDIDKWNKWDRNIKSEIKSVDYALLDGSFYENGEIPGRDMALIPHPFVRESIDLFKDMKIEDRKKVHFIHFNHTNPVIDPKSSAYQTILENGMGVATEHQQFPL